ncbi:hypothetical protein HDV05_007209 [Chytridiales sp. JEL 0842]|nr:hypothetical protein HDV05_007209 [Chytridiales sp. JEL 0842]
MAFPLTRTLRHVRTPLVRAPLFQCVRKAPLSSMVNPFTYLQRKMEKIDHATVIYEGCANQFNDQNNLLKRFNLQDDFQTWFAVTVLHIWIYNVRLRSEGPAGKTIKQEVFNTLWLDVELRLHKSGVRTGLGKIVSDLISSFYGQTLAYDEGLYEGDAVLASALWRNMCGARDISATELKDMVAYVRNHLQNVDRLSSSEITESALNIPIVKS